MAVREPNETTSYLTTEVREYLDKPEIAIIKVNRELNKEVAELKTAIEALKKSNTELLAKNETLEKQNAQLQTETDLQNQQLSQLQTDKSFLRISIQSRDKQIFELENKIQEIQHDRETTLKILKDVALSQNALEGELAKEKKLKTDLSEANNHLSLSLATEHRKAADLTSELNFTKDKLAYTEAQIAALQMSIRKEMADKFAAFAKETKNKLEEQSKFFTRETKKLKADYEKQINDYKKIIADNEAMLSGLQIKCENHAAEIMKLLEEKADRESKIDKLEYQNKFISADLYACFTTARTLESLYLDSLVTTKRTEEHAEMIHTTTKPMKKRLKNLSHELENAFETIAEQQKEIDRLTEENDSLHKVSLHK